jgi:hypothetical protein
VTENKQPRNVPAENRNQQRKININEIKDVMSGTSSTDRQKEKCTYNLYWNAIRKEATSKT